jgi:hypothetical protein
LALSSRISDAQECLDAALKCVSEQHDDSAGLIRQLVEEIRSKIN